LEDKNNETYTCAVTVAEVVSKVAREGKELERAYDILASNSRIVEVDEEFSKEAGLLHGETRKKVKDFCLADAYVQATARKTKSVILTGDIHFRDNRKHFSYCKRKLQHQTIL